MGDERAAKVAVIIPCFEQKQFLPKAIESALGQTVSPSEIIVVDDGSSEDLSTVTADYPGVTLIRQDNRGLAAARNTGMKAAASDKIIFLDSDDQLLPGAVAAGLRCFQEMPDAGFVYGGYILIENESEWRQFTRASTHVDLIRCNWIACVDSVMFDRAKLLAEGGFDESLRMTEDWDAYLRLSRKHPFAAFEEPVALYFKHEANMSNDVSELMRWINIVREKEKERGLTDEERRAWEEGEQIWRSFYYPTRRPFHRRLAGKLSKLLLGR